MAFPWFYNLKKKVCKTGHKGIYLKAVTYKTGHKWIFTYKTGHKWIYIKAVTYKVENTMLEQASHMILDLVYNVHCFLFFL